MKKQMITLAVCLALTATSALASSTATTSKAPTKAAIPVACQTKTPEVTQPTKEESLKQQFEEKMSQKRAELYCKLGLSNEQKDKAEAIHQTTKEGAEPLFARFHEEKAKLHELKAKKACPIKINEQKLKVKEAKHSIRAHMEKSRKEFEAILDKSQLAKFKAFREEKKAEWKQNKCKCHHHHHGAFTNKEGFQGPFGFWRTEEPVQNCPCESK